MQSTFALDPRLERDTHFLARWRFCQLRLMDDRRFPWLVLVPERSDLRDLHDVVGADQHLLLEEIVRASRVLLSETGAHKMNVAALGNEVSQLHIHVVARFVGDAAWPRPVWASGAAQAYGAAERDQAMTRLGDALRVP